MTFILLATYQLAQGTHLASDWPNGTGTLCCVDELFITAPYMDEKDASQSSQQLIISHNWLKLPGYGK